MKSGYTIHAVTLQTVFLLVWAAVCGGKPDRLIERGGDTTRQHRPLPPFRSQTQPEPQPPPSRTKAVRQRLGRFYARFSIFLLISAGIIVAMIAMLLYDQTKPLPQRLTQHDIDLAVERALESAKPQPSWESQVYEIIRPSLVRIQTLVLKDGEKIDSGLGTGIIVDDRGTILTNLHVIRDAEEIKVVFADGSESEVVVMVEQPENDLAVLRPLIIPDDLLPATLTDSRTLRVGDEVVAVGNPFGISNSLSSGVVSGLGRNFKSPKTGEILTRLIQFDAAVNPGNSGGPLLNRNGEVVGIVTALLNPNDQEVFIGIGFAVPIETAAAAGGAPPL